MAPSTLPIYVALDDAYGHVGHTYRRLRHHALTAALPITLIFEELLADYGPLKKKEIDLDGQVDDCAVEVTATDIALNGFAQIVNVEVLRLTKNNREHALYTHFFGDKPLHVFVRPLHGSQLAATKKWPASLVSSQHPSLAALAPELPPLLEKADAALAAKAAAEQQRSEFRDLGERKEYIDRVNAARKEAYGILSTFPHKYVGLPLNFADQFFRRDRSKAGEEETVEGLEEDIAALKAELAEKEARRDQLKAAEEKAAEEKAAAEAALTATKTQVAELKRELAEKQKQAAALAAMVGTNA